MYVSESFQNHSNLIVNVGSQLYTSIWLRNVIVDK